MLFQNIYVADPGCLSWIPIFPSRIQGQKGIKSRIRIRNKERKNFLPKNCCQALGNMIRDVIPDPRLVYIPDPDPPDPGVKKSLDPGSATLHLHTIATVLSQTKSGSGGPL